MVDNPIGNPYHAYHESALNGQTTYPQESRL